MNVTDIIRRKIGLTEREMRQCRAAAAKAAWLRSPSVMTDRIALIAWSE
jgi:hypothetical protein